MPARILNYTTALRKLFGEVLPKPLAWYNATIETQKLSVTAKNSHVSPRSHMTWPMCRMRREIASCQVCPHFVSLGGLLPFISACGFPCALFSKPSSEIEEGRLGQRSVRITDGFIKSVPVLFGWLFSCHMRPGKKNAILSIPFLFRWRLYRCSSTIFQTWKTTLDVWLCACRHRNTQSRSAQQWGDTCGTPSLRMRATYGATSTTFAL